MFPNGKKSWLSLSLPQAHNYIIHIKAYYMKIALNALPPPPHINKTHFYKGRWLMKGSHSRLHQLLFHLFHVESPLNFQCSAHWLLQIRRRRGVQYPAEGAVRQFGYRLRHPQPRLQHKKVVFVHHARQL